MSTTAITPVTLDVAKATISAELLKVFSNYPVLLQKAEGITFTKDTLEQDFAPLKDIRSVIKAIDLQRSAMKKPHLDSGKAIDDAAKAMTAPLADVLERKTAEYTKLVREIEEEREKIRKENERVAAIRNDISSTLVALTDSVVASVTDDDVVTVEKKIGSLKTQKSRFQEFLPELCEKLDALVPAIRAQKDIIRKAAAARAEMDRADKSGDDEAFIKASERVDELALADEEKRIQIQEQVINQVTSAPVTPVYIEPSAPKARRTTWKAEIVDVDAAIKKSKHLLDITLKASVVSDSIKTLKETGVFDGKKEVVIGGIRYYEEKLY